MTGVLGGHLDVMVSSLSTPLPHLETGKLRTIAVAAPTRLPGAYASAPTWKELGVNTVALFWRGAIGPKGMTPASVAFWEAELEWVVSTEEWKKYLADNLLVADFQNARGSAKFLQSEYAEYKAILTELGLAK